MDFLFTGFASAFWSSATFGDKILFAVDAAAFGFLLALVGVGAVAFAWLANRPQPKPSPGVWRLATVSWRSQHGRQT